MALRICIITVFAITCTSCAFVMPKSAGAFPTVDVKGDKLCMGKRVLVNRQCFDLPTEKNETAKRETENLILTNLMVESEQRCSKFINRMSNRLKYSFFLDAFSILTAAGATVALTENEQKPPSKQNNYATYLTAASGVLNALSSYFDEKFDKEEIESALEGIKIARANEQQIIYKRMDKKGSYTFNEGVEDVIKYHNLCSLSSGANQNAIQSKEEKKRAEVMEEIIKIYERSL